MRKYLTILLILTPFLVWQDIIPTANIRVDDETWEVSEPYEFDLEPLDVGIHYFEFGPVVFEYEKSEMENKKFIFRDHTLIYDFADSWRFETDSYREKIKK